jgi:hypothetical protein
MTGSLTITGAGSNLSVSGTLGVTGNTTLTANLTVDTNTLYVDSVGKRIGVGLNPSSAATSDSKLQVFGGALGTTSGNATYIASFENTNSNYSRLLIFQRRNANGSDWQTEFNKNPTKNRCNRSSIYRVQPIWFYFWSCFRNSE